MDNINDDSRSKQSIQDRIKSILKSQNDMVQEIDNLSRDISDNDSIIKQNELLKEKIEKCEKEIEKLNNELKELKDENSGLKLSLRDQIVSEKGNLLKASKRKLKDYFGVNKTANMSNLQVLENNLKMNCTRLKKLIDANLNEAEIDLKIEVDKLEHEINERILQERADIKENDDKLNEEMDKQYYTLSQLPVKDELIDKRTKQNNIEMKLGLSLFNKIGLVLILLGVATVIKYTYTTWFTAYMKGISVFILGALFIAAGEYMIIKKHKDVFSIGLNAGGIAILYYAIQSSYFFLKIMNLNVAMILAIFITTIAILFSIKYNSKTISIFSLIGGYLPFFTFSYAYSFSLMQNDIYITMAYVLLLNILILIISYWKKWQLMNYVSFLFNVPVSIYLIQGCTNDYLSIGYCILNFILYLAVILLYPLRYKISLKAWDIFLLALNTFVNCILVYKLFDESFNMNLRGCLALIYCIIYFIMGKIVEIKVPNEKSTRLLFYITSLTFVFLVVPFQFGIGSATIGWAIEGILMIVYGKKEKINIIERAGQITFIICMTVFYIFILMPYSIEGSIVLGAKHIQFKYACVIAGTIISLITYFKDAKEVIERKFTSTGRLLDGFKYFGLLSILIYLYFENDYAKRHHYFAGLNNTDFYKVIIFIVINLAFVYIVGKFKNVMDDIVKVSLYSISAGTCLCLLLIDNNISTLKNSFTSEGYVSLIILILTNVACLIWIRNTTKNIISDMKKSNEHHAIIVGVYLLLQVVLFINGQVYFDIAYIITDIAFMILAFFYIYTGFKKKYLYLRRLGLFLVFFANAKLFIYDLSNLEKLWKIAAYFSFGFIMLFISFIYQKIKKVMEEAEL